MAFKEDLEQICGKVDGSFAASVMGFDGIPIETHEVRPPDGIELQSLLVEYSGIVSQVRQAAEDIKHGRPATIAIAATDRDIGSDYSRALPLRRADTIREALMREGVAPSQIDVAAAAETTPTPALAASITPPQGRARISY